MDGCLFCKISNKEIPADIVFEDKHLIAFKDIDPQAPKHILIIPKKHVETLMDITDNDNEWWIKVPQVAQSIAQKEGIDKKGFRLVVNCRDDGGQEVNHIHFHILGGRKMKWPPG